MDWQKAVAELSLSTIVLSGAVSLYVFPTAAELYTGFGPVKVNDHVDELGAAPYTNTTLSVSADVVEEFRDGYRPVKENGWCLISGRNHINQVGERDWINRDRDYVAFECAEGSIRAHTHPVTATISEDDRSGLEQGDISCIYSGGSVSKVDPVNLNCYTRTGSGDVRRTHLEVVEG